MEIKNSFEVARPPAETWNILLDIERIAPCMPGAELTQVVDPRTYKGKVSVRLGPVALAFVGTATFDEIDEASRRARVKAQGTDQKGRGGANAIVTFALEPIASGTRVNVSTNLNLSGSVAQYGRGSGMIQDVATQLIGQFAKSLQAMLAAQETTAAATSSESGGQAPAIPRPAPAPAAKPISGFSLMLRVLWNAIRRLFSGGRRAN